MEGATHIKEDQVAGRRSEILEGCNKREMTHVVTLKCSPKVDMVGRYRLRKE